MLSRTLSFLLCMAASPLLADPPSFTQEPAPQSVFVGANVLLSAQATSPLPINYQWRANNNDLPGETNNTLSLFCSSLVQSGLVYTVMASNAGGAVISGPALLKVSPPSSSSLQYSWGTDPITRYDNFAPNNRRNEVGSTYVVFVQNTNIGNVWGTDVYTDDSSVAAAAVHTGLLPVGTQGSIRLKLLPGQSQYVGSTRFGISSFAYGNWPGSYQPLGRAPTITQPPRDVARMIGGTASFNTVASGVGTLHYQWLFNGTPISGETGPSLSFLVTSLDQAGSYSVSITDDNTTATSDYAILGVLPPTAPPLQSPSAPYNLPIGTTANFLVTGDTNAVIYGRGFFYAVSPLGAAAVFSGLLQNGEQGSIAVVRLPDQPNFMGEIRNGVTASKTSQGPAYALLGRAPLVIVNPISQALFPGQSTVLSATASYPGAVTYQWRKNGQDLAGKVGPSLTVNADDPPATSIYDLLIKVPGVSALTLPAYVITVPPTSSVHYATTPNEARQYLGTAGNLVYLTLQVPLSPSGPVWGTGTYTYDSDFPTAAVHAGILQPGQTAQVAMYSLGRLPSFYGSTQYGITTVSYGAFAGIAFVAPGSTPPGDIHVGMTSPGRLLVFDATGRTCEIQSSPNMALNSWSARGTIVPTNSPQLWVDPSSVFGHLFYRVRLR